MKGKYMGFGVAMGVAIGAGIGASMGHIAQWTGIGVAIGVAIGFLMGRAARPISGFSDCYNSICNRDSLSPEDTKRGNLDYLLQVIRDLT